MEDMVDGRWGILGVDNIGRGREEDEDEQLGRGQKKNGEMIKYAVKFSRPNSARLPTHTVSSRCPLTLACRLSPVHSSPGLATSKARTAPTFRIYPAAWQNSPNFLLSQRPAFLALSGFIPIRQPKL